MNPQAALLFHPLADLFPLLDGAEFDELVEDIRHNGVRESIWLYKDKILDGRNRYRAASVAGVPCPTIVYYGDDPLGFVVSLNLKRRHLDTSQRAMIAARLANMRQGERTDLDLPSIGGRLVSQKEAADLLNIGVKSVERAKIVHEQGDPELVAAVETGKVSVSGAVEQIRRGMVTGVAMHPHAERGLDLYPTPPEAVRALLKVERFEGVIWEPANGRGPISRELRADGYRTVATDIADYGVPDAVAGVDFLAQTASLAGVTTILTNPPFMLANEFVRHALSLVPRVVMLLPLTFLDGQGRVDLLKGGHLSRVYVFLNRLPGMHRDGWDGPRTSTRMAFAWFCWDRAHRGDPVLRFISWEPAILATVADSDMTESGLVEPGAPSADGLDIPGFLLRRRAP